MTNFEKWKSELRPEDFIEIYKEDNSMQCKGAICKICPVRKSCEKLVNPFVTEADILGLIHIVPPHRQSNVYNLACPKHQLTFRPGLPAHLGVILGSFRCLLSP